MSINNTSFTMVPRWHRSPLSRECRHSSSIQHAESEEMVELQTHAVHCPVETTLDT